MDPWLIKEHFPFCFFVFQSTMTMLHELGHNLGLGHAYEDNIPYSDMSTVMGYSHRNVKKMCYNGQNYWALGWFPDRSYEVMLSNNKNSRELVDLAFYGDYHKTNVFQPVVLKYNDIYMTFNLQRGLNAETKEYPNTLLVVQELPGEYHYHTNLEVALSVGDEPYQMTFDTGNKNNNKSDRIFIEVCSHTMGSFETPEYLSISVGRTAGGCRSSLVTVSRNVDSNP